jgi:hypothetical protein
MRPASLQLPLSFVLSPELTLGAFFILTVLMWETFFWFVLTFVEIV